MYNEGDRSSMVLEDRSHLSCVSPFEFNNMRYLARIPVHRGFSRLHIIQVYGQNITCHPLEGLRVYALSSVQTDSVDMCETLPFMEIEQGLVVCSYRCPCYNGCHQVFIEAFNYDGPDNAAENMQLCEIII